MLYQSRQGEQISIEHGHSSLRPTHAWTARLLFTFSISRCDALVDERRIGAQVMVLAVPSVIGDDIDHAGTSIVQTIRQSGARVVLIDGFQGITGMLATPDRIRRTLADLVTLLSYLDVILLVSLEGAARTRR